MDTRHGELELLHECWLARLPPARIAARLGISEPKLNRFMRWVHSARAMPRPEPAKPRQLRHQASSSDADGLFARMFGTTFRDILSSRQIALIGSPCTKNARRIFAIISTISIPTSAYIIMEASVTLSPGVPIGCRSPRKRGPYSTPKHTWAVAGCRLFGWWWRTPRAMTGSACPAGSRAERGSGCEG